MSPTPSTTDPPPGGPPEHDQVESPPSSVLGIVGRLGPGLIIAGSIVGSGELIATTKTGAQAGFWLLWLIIIGCVIKVFVQVEFGRYAISSGKATMAALDEVPGPRVRVNWLVWYWLVMFIFSLAQLGGIVGGVGQSMAMSLPIDGSFNRLLAEQDRWDERADGLREDVERVEIEGLESRDLRARRAAQGRVDAELVRRLGGPRPSWRTPGYFWTDDITWATLLAVVTVGVLVVGRYGLIQNVSMVMVAAFTAVTIFCVFALQSHAAWAVHWSDLSDGLSFRLPPAVEGAAKTPLATAMATFGIIGVGTTELIAYPYWCVEKGYARFTGPRHPSPDWGPRAQGWMRVMRWDAGLSMVIYTFATVAFYLLGAAVLNRAALDPEGTQMIRTLGEMYVPVFGIFAKWLFLFGAFAVLYSTFFVATAGHTRVAADAVRVARFGEGTEAARLWWVRAFCIGFPVFALAVCIFIRHPVKLVLASGVMQALMLPMLAGATLYFRYLRCDRRILPGKLWDLLLWVSAIGMLLAGTASGWFALENLWRQMG